MHRTLEIALFSVASFCAFSALHGCKVSSCTEPDGDGGTTTKDDCYRIEPTIEYRDSRVRTGFQNWSPGHSVTVTNHNGPLSVQLDDGLDQQVVVSGIAFTREVSGETGKQKATEHLATVADPAITSNAGDIVVDGPGKGVDGYDLTVRLPNNFNGVLSIVAENGKLVLRGAPESPSTTAVAHGIKAIDLRNAIHLTSTAGSIDVTAVPSGAGNVIHADVGDILARIGMANLAITAKTDLGKVTFPPAWTVQMVSSDGKSGTATLGDGSGALSVTSDNGSIDFATP